MDYLVFRLIFNLNFKFKSLNLREYVLDEQSRDEAIYELVSVSLHFGTAMGGHCKLYLLNIIRLSTSLKV